MDYRLYWFFYNLIRWLVGLPVLPIRLLYIAIKYFYFFGACFSGGATQLSWPWKWGWRFWNDEE